MPDIRDEIAAARKVEKKAATAFYKVNNVLRVLKEVRYRVEMDYPLEEAWTRWGLSGRSPQLKRWFAKSQWADLHYPTDEEMAEVRADNDRVEQAYRDAMQHVHDLEDIQRAGRKARKRTEEIRGGKRTCPVCFRLFRLQDSRMPRHGWREYGKRQRGAYGLVMHTSACFGTGYEPFEVSSRGTEDYIEELQAQREHMLTLNQSMKLRDGTTPRQRIAMIDEAVEFLEQKVAQWLE